MKISATPLVTLLLSLTLAESALAMTLTLDDGTVGPQPYQRWLNEAKVPLPTNDVVLHIASCPPPNTEPACARPDEIWLNPIVTAEKTRSVFLHEVGHQFDYSVMTDPARLMAQEIRHDPRPWRQGPNSSHERFATAWAACALHPTIKNRINWGYRYAPRPAVYEMMCRLMWFGS